MAVETTYRKVKLWNRHSEDFSQVVKGDKIHIPAGKSITVSRRQALDIRGHYPGKNVKTKLEIEPILETIDVPEEWLDHKTGRTFSSREALLRHLGVDPGTKAKPDFDCVVCGSKFKSKDELLGHLPECVRKHAPKEAAPAAKK